jgi:hypothetical protein
VPCLTSTRPTAALRFLDVLLSDPAAYRPAAAAAHTYIARVTVPSPDAPILPFPAPGRPVVLHRGAMSVSGVSGTGALWLQMTGEAHYRWEFEGGERHPTRLGDTVLRFAHPALGSVGVPVRVNSEDGRGSIGSASLGTADRLLRVVAPWINIPPLPAERALRADDKEVPLAWTGEGGGWSLALRAREDLDATVAEAKDTPFSAMTHTGRLSRADGRPFTGEQALDALHAWQTALSFAVGRWVAPGPVTGLSGGRQAWESWKRWRCETPRHSESWWNTSDAQALHAFTRLFVDAWTDPRRHDRTRHVAMHIIEGNRPGTTLEARIMLVGAALEYLSWVTHVLGGTRTASQHRKRSAAENLRELLAAAHVDASVPVELDALERLREQERLDDAPDAIAWLRNRLVHPKDAGEPYRLDGLIVQTWQLLMQYAELLLLHDLGYAGAFCRRFPPGRWAHDSRPVPWSAA